MSMPMNFDVNRMSPAEFEEYLPELFAAGRGRVSNDPHLNVFFSRNPDCLALVRDLEAIADAARNILQPDDSMEGPGDAIWSGIENKLKLAASGEEPA